MTPTRATNRLTGGLLMVITALVVMKECGLGSLPHLVLPWAIISATLLLSVQVRAGRYAFALVAFGLTVALMLTQADWLATTERALQTAAFIVAFFCALATLRSAADTSPSIRASGRFLAQQPPGRRYLALTVGGQMFSLLLNYGAIALLGGLATASADEEPDPEIRRHRTRRMLLAIQRAFTSMLPWSPMSFAIAITTALIPGARWADAVLPGVATSVLMAGTGWALDTIFKPRLTQPRPATKPPEGTWALMLPLILLLAILVVAIVVLHEVTDIRVVGLVMLVVPTIALIWVLIQTWGTGGLGAFGRRLSGYTFAELPEFCGEILLLMMAGYIGTVGAPLLGPVLAGAGLDLTAMPTTLVLMSFVWIIPLAGQLGMNPILAVTLMAPLIPAPEALGVSPTAIVVAITAGWALSGVTSPFTATTLLIGGFGKVSAAHVGLVWNRSYALTVALLLSAWVALFAQL